MRRQRSREKGFTMIEVMFAAAIVALGTYYFMDSLAVTGQDYEILSDRLIANQILQQSVSNLQTTSGLFPYVAGTSGSAGVYVICSNRNGEPTKDASGTPIQIVTFAATAGNSTGKCSGSEVESQYVPSLSNPSSLAVYILFYNRATGKLLSTHQQTMHLDRNI